MAIVLEGLAEVRRDFKNKFSKINNASKKGIKKAGLFLEDKSVMIVPVISGDLRRSANTDYSNLQTQGYVEVGYNESYALKRHESPPEDSPSDSSKHWKFLENPFKENVDGMINIIKLETEREVQR